MNEQIMSDMLLHGTALYTTAPDGTTQRIDPKEIYKMPVPSIEPRKITVGVDWAKGDSVAVTVTYSHGNGILEIVHYEEHPLPQAGATKGLRGQTDLEPSA